MPIGQVGQVIGAENLLAVNDFTPNPAVPEPNLDSYQTQMPTIVDALIAESGEGWQNGVWHIQPGQAEREVSYIEPNPTNNEDNNTFWSIVGTAVSFIILIFGIGYMGSLHIAPLVQDPGMLETQDYRDQASLMI